MADYLKHTYLYEFELGPSVWRFTSNAEDVIDVDGNVWEAVAISDDGVSQSGETVSDALTISASIDIPPARLWMHNTPDSVMDVRMLKADFPDKPVVTGFEGLVDEPSNRVIPVANRRVRYVGEVSHCSFNELPKAVFSIETISATMQRSGLHLKWQRQCPYTIYHPLTCKANKLVNAVAGVITSINGPVIGVGVTMDLNHFAAGILEYMHPEKGLCSVTIESNTSGALRLFGSSRGMWLGLAVTLYRGCNNTPDACRSHDNYLNYGGFDRIPGKSPFNGINSPMF